jgi:hypothetical protein
MPAAGAVGALSEELVSAFSSATVGVTAVAAAALLAVTFWFARRHGHVDSRNVIAPEPARLAPRPVPAV